MPSGKDQQTVTYTKTETAGFYKALLEQPSHKTETRNFAVNVDAAEGDLRGLTGSDLASRLSPVNYKFDTASNFQTQVDETAGPQPGRSVPVDSLDRAHCGAVVRLVVQLPYCLAT